MLDRLQTWLIDNHRKKLKTQLKDARFEFLFNKEQDVFVSFDCETTGLNKSKDRIITLSAIKILGNKILTSQSLNLAIKQEQAISEESIAIHQIRNLDVVNDANLYDDEMQAMEAFLHFIGGATLIGYYLEFDVAMVNQIIKPKLGILLPNSQIDVAGMYHEYQREKHRRSCIEPNIDLSFQAILTTLEMPKLAQHNAFNDALMSALIFLKLKQLKLSS